MKIISFLDRNLNKIIFVSFQVNVTINPRLAVSLRDRKFKKKCVVKTVVAARQPTRHIGTP